MKRIYYLITVLFVTLALPFGCSQKDGDSVTRAPASGDLPYFESVEWPGLCSELPEGRLVITGRAVFPNGYNHRIPIELYVFPGINLCGPGEGGGAEGGKVLPSDPEELSYVQELIQKARDYTYGEVNGRKAQSNGDDGLPEQCQRYCLASKADNGFSYFSEENGRFRLDFDQRCRFKFGDKILILVAIDELGQSVAAANFYTIQNYVPWATEALTDLRHNYGTMMSGFGQGMIDVLSYYPMERTMDMAIIATTKGLFEQAYLGEPTLTHYKSLGQAYGSNMRMLAENITDPFVKEGLLWQVDWIEYCFVDAWDTAQRGHFQFLYGDQDPIQNFQAGLDFDEEVFTEYEITVERTYLPHGVLSVHFNIKLLGEEIADFVMVGSPGAALVVTGMIGEDSIQPQDYNPYFIEIFKKLSEARFAPMYAW